MTAQILKMKSAPKALRSTMSTSLFNRAEMADWQLPPCQRELRVNEKVREVAAELQLNGGMVSGIITLGRLKSTGAIIWLVDGQHRREGFKLSGLDECIADVRVIDFDTMADLAREFVRLNSRLVTMRPDDNMRALESCVPALARITSACDFVGYGQVRRVGSKSPVLSMSAAVRCWAGSTGDTPAANGSGKSSTQTAQDMDLTDADHLVVFLLTAREAWGADPEYFRLWGNLNLTVCMWMWRKLVLDKVRGVNRAVVLTPTQFKKCLMSVSADKDYLDWLPGRLMGDRDRSPSYSRLKAIFAKRLQADANDNKKVQLPAPAWWTRT